MCLRMPPQEVLQGLDGFLRDNCAARYNVMADHLDTLFLYQPGSSGPAMTVRCSPRRIRGRGATEQGKRAKPLAVARVTGVTRFCCRHAIDVGCFASRDVGAPRMALCCMGSVAQWTLGPCPCVSARGSWGLRRKTSTTAAVAWHGVAAGCSSPDSRVRPLLQAMWQLESALVEHHRLILKHRLRAPEQLWDLEGALITAMNQ